MLNKIDSRAITFPAFERIDFAPLSCSRWRQIAIAISSFRLVFSLTLSLYPFKPWQFAFARSARRDWFSCSYCCPKQHSQLILELDESPPKWGSERAEVGIALKFSSLDTSRSAGDRFERLLKCALSAPNIAERGERMNIHRAPLCARLSCTTHGMIARNTPPSGQIIAA